MNRVGCKIRFWGQGGEGGWEPPKANLTSNPHKHKQSCVWHWGSYGMGYQETSQPGPRQKALHTIRAPGTMKIERAEATCGPGSWTEGLGRP